MKSYSDLLATSQYQLNVELEIDTIGSPDYTLTINSYQVLSKQYSCQLSLVEPIIITLKLQNKIYTLEYETAVVFKKLIIDGVSLIPKYDYLAVYTNDHDNTNPTSYIGFNGTWQLVIDRPFYHWLHWVQSHGLMLD